MTKAAYRIIVGETGNECGHVTVSEHVSDAAAIRKAKRMCRAYDGDGWWRVVRDCQTIGKGGREQY